MASYSFILGKAELAVRDALRAKAFSWIADEQHVQAGMTAGDIDQDPDAAPDSTGIPSITCEASSAEVTVPNTATFRVQCSVHVAHSPDDSNYATVMDQHGEVSDAIFDPAFLAALNNDGFTAFGIYQTDQSKTTKGRKWVSTFGFYIECAGSQIS